MTTIVYSAFSTQLQIKGEAIVRSDNDIRITNIKVIEQNNGAYETYNNKYTKDTTSMSVTLPSNSSITYEIQLNNKSNVNAFIEEIKLQSNTNENINIYISLNKYDVLYKNDIKKFIIQLNNETDEVQNETLIYKYKFKQDNEYPTLQLSKITYIEGFNGWTFNNSYVDYNGILILGEDGNSSSSYGYYETNGGSWYPEYEALTTTALTDSNLGGIHNSFAYFDENFENATSSVGYMNNGVAFKTELNTWSSSYIDARYAKKEISSLGIGGTIKYISFWFYTGNQFSQPIVKIRDFKLYGDSIPNSFYLININSFDNEEILIKKYSKGHKTEEYFKSDGIEIHNNQVKVTENGIYTVYVSDIVGNSTIETIEITNIK